MKKLLLILLILVPTLVRAEETEKRYKYYYLEKEYSNTFYKEGENNEEYPEKSDIYTFGSIVSSTTKPEIEEDIVEVKTLTKYQEAKKVRYIMIENMNSTYSMILEEIEVWNKGEKLEYKPICGTCSSSFFKSVQNTVLRYDANYINNGATFTLDLKKEYFPDDLTLKIYMSSSNGERLNFNLVVNNTKNVEDTYYAKDIEEELTSYKEIVIPISDIQNEERWEDEVKETTEEVTENAKIIQKDPLYFYRERYYLYYRMNKKYLEGYYSDIAGLIKDEDDYQEVEIVPNIEYIEVPVEVEKIVEVPVEVEKVVEIPVEVEKIVEIPVEVEKIVEKVVEVPVEVEKIVEVPIEVEKIIEKEIEIPIEVEKIVEKEVEVEKIVEIPVEVEKVIEKEVEKLVEIPVEVEKFIETQVEVPVEVEKVIEKEIEKIVEVPVEVEKIIKEKTKPNYLAQYVVFLGFGLILRKMSFFK